MKNLSHERIGRLRDAMAGYVERAEIPGMVAVVSRRGEAFIDPIGTTTDGGGEPVRSDTIFRIASMTKPVTAVAAMILVEEGKLRLAEPVDRLLPELANRQVLKSLDGPIHDTVPAKRPITVYDLLTFTMGFGIPGVMPGTYPVQQAADALDLGQGPPKPLSVPEPDEWIRRLGTLPLMHQPGEQWMYSTGADVLGVLIARASGQPFDVFLRERIFEPLGMRDTAFSVSAEKLDRFLPAYWRDHESGRLLVVDPPAEGQWSRPPAFPAGAAGLVSTAEDYLAFAQMMLDNGIFGHERILSRPSVELMTSDHLTPEQKAISGLTPGYFDTHGWGFCLSVVTRQVDLSGCAGSYGWNGGYGTLWNNDPREEMITILLTQRLLSSPAPPDVFQDFLTLAYQAIDD